jgi:hypothetical protein
MRFLSRVVKTIKGNFFLIAALAIGFVLRILSTHPGYLYAGDEIMANQAIYMLLNKTLGFSAYWVMGYPPLVAWIMLFFFIVFFIPGTWIIHIISHFQDFVSLFGGLYQTSGSIVLNLNNIFKLEILGKDNINALYWGRYLTALFGTSVIYLTYLTALNLFNKKVAIISAFLVAVNYRLVLSSHIGFIDMYNVFFLLLSFWSVSLLIKKPDLRHYLLVWLSVALSFLTKYQIYSFFPLILAHFYLSIKNSGCNFRLFLKKVFSKEVVIGGLAALVLVVIFHYYHLLHLEEVVEYNHLEVAKYGFGKNSFDLFPISYLYHQGGIGPLLSIFSLGGILLGLVKRKSVMSSLVLLSPVPMIAYLYFYYTSGGFYTRNVIVLIPIFLIFSSVFLIKLLGLILKQKHLFLKLLGLLFLSLAVFFSFKDSLINSFILASTYSRQSPESLAQKWIEENIKGNVFFGVDNYRLIPSDQSVRSIKLPTPKTAFSYRELLAEKFDFVEMNVSMIHSYFLFWWMKQPWPTSVKFWERPDDLLAQNYELLAVRELMWEHGQKAFLTTWQAPGNNFAVFKIDKEKLCGDSTFKEKADIDSLSWDPLYFLPGNKMAFRKDELLKPVIKGEKTLPGVIRWGSSPLAVKQNHCYQVVGKIDIKDDLPKTNRSGFLRIDFYREVPKVSLTVRSFVSFLSERVYGEAGSHSAAIQVIAPSEARYATIGFQADGPSTDQTLLDLKVLESNKPVDKPEPKHLFLKDENILLYNIDGII